MTTRDDDPAPNPGLMILLTLPLGLPIVAAVIAIIFDGVRFVPAVVGAYAVGLLLSPVLAFVVNRRARQTSKSHKTHHLAKVRISS